MRSHFLRAIENIVTLGDTDIFPFPIENHMFFDRKGEISKLLLAFHKEFERQFVKYPPAHESLLAPIGYNGFRWATQLDPFWNAYFLGIVLSIANEIEAARIPTTARTVFSYRVNADKSAVEIFQREYGWFPFMEHSLEHAGEHSHVITCDISDFYPRIGHHRLENALNQLDLGSDIPSRIMKFLENFSNSRSYGLPIGGPASRILSELVLNQVDRLLVSEGILFCRFADDYHIFTDSLEGAYNHLVFLSEKLFRNEGLALQKSKTRVMSGAEFIATSPLSSVEKQTIEGSPKAVAQTLTTDQKSLLRFSIRFDPYSPTAEDDYEALKNELSQFDILGLIRAELSKSRVHIAFAKKIVSTIRFLDDPQKTDAVLSLLENAELLYPIFSTVMLSVQNVFDELLPETQKEVHKAIRNLISEGSHVIRVDLNLAYAIRVLGRKQSPENIELFSSIFKERTAAVIRRDIILIMAKWKEWYWISDLRNDFRLMGSAERRAFIIASFILGDEGRHWRKSMKKEFSPFESELLQWMSAKKNSDKNWGIPI